MKLRTTLLFLMSAAGLLTAAAQGETPADTASAPEKPAPEERIRVWRLDETLGTIVPAEADTAYTNFHNTSTDAAFGIANAWVGNIGSPMESKLFFEREKKSEFLFVRPYNNYFKSAEDIKFYNTKTPFTNLSYYTGGPSYGKEERLKASFAVNVTPDMSFGFNVDYIYGRGMYIAQSTNDILGNFWTSYQGRRYWCHAAVAINRLKNYESGGIKNDSVVTHPDLMPTRIKAENMEVNIESGKKAQAKLKNQIFYYTHKFRTGKDVTNADDSTTTFVPVINFIHTIKYEHDNKRYRENDTTAFYAAAPMLNTAMTRDEAGLQTVKNTFGVEMTEEFNQKGKFGLTGYVSHEFMKYQFFRDKIWQSENENNILVGGEWAKKSGKHLNYSANGEVGIYGRKAGGFSVSGNISSQFNLGKKRAEFEVKASVENECPDFFMEHYESNYFKWDNNFDFQTTARVAGRFAMPDWHLALSGEFVNIKNYLYFNNLALPAQYGDNVQVLAVSLQKDFHVWLLHLENKVTYQESSMQRVAPLPRVACYHNLYLMAKIFKVLTFQIGADVHYHTSYKAQSYMPATGMFYNSGRKIGNYPVASVYGVIHLKRMRFFAMYYHMNYKFSNNQYFSMPSYPINPGVLKLGLSWNFYD